MKKKLLSLIVLCLTGVLVHAQELNCKVTIMHDKIPGVDPEVFNSMQRAITEFLNSHKWTSEEYGTTEKIDATFFITLTGNKVNGDPDAYSASLTVQASRPVYNAGYVSTLVNYMDRDFAFKFAQFNNLQFDDNTVNGADPMISNLPAVLAYYCYIIIGLDNDSFSPEGGTNMFKKAQNVVNNAPELNKTIAGWKAVEGTKNRYWLVDQLLNNRFQDVRTFWYTLHREGLDSMYTKPIDARNRILTGLRKLYNVNRENPSSMLMQFVFSAKSEEILHVLAQSPKNDRGQYITLLDAMDVPNSTKYNALR